MEDKIIYESRISVKYYMICLIILIPLSMIYDYKEDNQLFTESYLYLIPIFIMLLGTLFGIFSYDKITLSMNEIILKSYMFRKNQSIPLNQVDNLEFFFKRFLSISIKYKGVEKIKNNLPFSIFVSKNDFRNILYILYVNKISVDCKGLVSRNWENEAYKKFGNMTEIFLKT